MTSRRRTLVAVFPILLLPFFAGVGVGIIELFVWLAAGILWLTLFVVWGRRR